jgi:hypothetical protein
MAAEGISWSRAPKKRPAVSERGGADRRRAEGAQPEYPEREGRDAVPVIDPVIGIGKAKPEESSAARGAQVDILKKSPIRFRRIRLRGGGCSSRLGR